MSTDCPIVDFIQARPTRVGTLRYNPQDFNVLLDPNQNREEKSFSANSIWHKGRRGVIKKKRSRWTVFLSMLGTWRSSWSPVRELSLPWPAFQPDQTTGKGAEVNCGGISLHPPSLDLWFLPHIYPCPRLWMPMLINNRDRNSIHKKNGYRLTLWDRLTSWPGRTLASARPLHPSVCYSP